MRLRLIVIGGALILLAVLTSLCAYTVQADQFAVLTSFGKPGEIHKDPGLYFKMPTPFSLVNRLDKRMQLYRTPLIEYLTGDKKNLIIQTFICWKISDPLQFFQAIHDVSAAEQKIDDIVCSLVASTLGDHQMNEIISTNPDDVKTEEMAESITNASKGRSKEYGIEIIHVGFSRVALPEDNARSVYRRMIAERSSIANEYRAKGRQRAAEIRAEAEREKSDILADAYKQSEIIRGEGDALSAEIYGNAYSKSPKFFKFLRTLEADKKALKDNTTVILSSDSELFQVLKPEK